MFCWHSYLETFAESLNQISPIIFINCWASERHKASMGNTEEFQNVDLMIMLYLGHHGHRLQSQVIGIIYLFSPEKYQLLAGRERQLQSSFHARSGVFLSPSNTTLHSCLL